MNRTIYGDEANTFYSFLRSLFLCSVINEATDFSGTILGCVTSFCRAFLFYDDQVCFFGPLLSAFF